MVKHQLENTSHYFKYEKVLGTGYVFRFIVFDDWIFLSINCVLGYELSPYDHLPHVVRVSAASMTFGIDVRSKLCMYVLHLLCMDGGFVNASGTCMHACMPPHSLFF